MRERTPARRLGVLVTLAFVATSTGCREDPANDASITESVETLGYVEHRTSIVPFSINGRRAAASNFDREFALYDRLVEFIDTETSPGGNDFETTYRASTTDPIDFVVAANASTVYVATTDASRTMTLERWDISTAPGSLTPPVAMGTPSPIGVPSPFPSTAPSKPIGGTFIEPSSRAHPPTLRRTVVSRHGSGRHLAGVLPDPQNRYILTLEEDGRVARYDIESRTSTMLTSADAFPVLVDADAGRILDHSERGRIMMFHAPNLGTSGTATAYLSDADNDGVFESIEQGTKSDLVANRVYGLMYWDMLYR